MKGDSSYADMMENLKSYQAFGWDDPFGEETILLSSVDRLLCTLTKSNLEEQRFSTSINSSNQLRGGEVSQLVVKVFEDRDYPKTKVILILLAANQHLFDRCYQDESTSSSNLTFEINVKMLGISLLDSHPREILYFQVDHFALKLKSHNKRFEVLAELGDVQGDFQAAKPFPTPFFVTKKHMSSSASAAASSSSSRGAEQKSKRGQVSSTSGGGSARSAYPLISSVFEKISNVLGLRKQLPPPASLTGITPSSQPALRKKEKKQQKSFFKVNYVQQYYKSTSINHIERFSLEVQPIEIDIDGNLIHKLVLLLKELQHIHSKSAAHEKKKKPHGTSSKQQQLMRNPKESKKHHQQSVQRQKKFLIEKFDILPLSIDIRFTNLHSRMFGESSKLTYFLMTLLNLIGSNKFAFERFHNENHLHSATELIRQIVLFYSGLIEKQIFNIIANANLIGNPGQLFREIGFACIEFANTIFDEVHRSELLIQEERLFQSAFKSGYILSKRVFQAFKSSAQVISRSIISELFYHVGSEGQTGSSGGSSSSSSVDQYLQPALKDRSGGVPNLLQQHQSEQQIISEVNQMRKIQGSFVNLFHAAFLFPLSTPYSLNSITFRAQQRKLDTKKIKSLLPLLKVKRYPRALTRINYALTYAKYDQRKALGKLFFESFNLVEYDEFENIIEHIYPLCLTRVLFITKDRLVVVDEDILKIVFNVSRSDISSISISTEEGNENSSDAVIKLIRLKYCSQSKGKEKEHMLSMKILNLEEARFEVDFSPLQIAEFYANLPALCKSSSTTPLTSSIGQ